MRTSLLVQRSVRSASTVLVPVRPMLLLVTLAVLVLAVRLPTLAVGSLLPTLELLFGQTLLAMFALLSPLPEDLVLATGNGPAAVLRSACSWMPKLKGSIL